MTKALIDNAYTASCHRNSLPDSVVDFSSLLRTRPSITVSIFRDFSGVFKHFFVRCVFHVDLLNATTVFD